MIKLQWRYTHKLNRNYHNLVLAENAYCLQWIVVNTKASISLFRIGWENTKDKKEEEEEEE